MQPQKEKLGFQAEVNQVLNLVIHALYSNSEIFLRELISNASDAGDKLRFEALEDNALLESDPELKINIEFDPNLKLIKIRDNGIGMNREEVIANLGTIAKSGTKEFLSKLSGDQAKDSHLIGQFGVGFYSAFIVADRVTVLTRRAGLTSEHGVKWESNGQSEYSIENLERAARGTEIILHLKSESEEFLDNYRLKNIIQKYSDHIAMPILMKKTKEEKEGQEEKDKENKATEEWEVVNRAQALWTRPKVEIKEEEYQELYKHIAHDFENPITWVHNKIEGKLDYTTLLYIPSRAPFDLFQPESHHGLKLYIKRVFILDDAKQFLPLYLRFVRGIVDSNDLPLNISREILQQHPMIEKIKSSVTKRILDLLEEMTEKEPEKYKLFWKNFGKVLKEGPAEDFVNRENIAKLLRFSSTHTDNEEQIISLKDYVSRMKPDQDKIYYVTADSFAAAKNSPHLEIFRQKAIEVLLLSDRIDEWLVTHLSEFEGKSLISVAKGDLDLGKLDKEEAEKTQEKAKGDYADLLTRVKSVLSSKIKDVRLTHRLTNSPACLVADHYDMNRNMQYILASMGQKQGAASLPILELNPEHKLIQRLKSESDAERFSEWADILFSQALLAEGGKLDDPAAFVSRLNKFLLELMG